MMLTQGKHNLGICLATWAVCSLFLLFSACGYRFAGQGRFPDGIKRVSVGTFVNQTTEPRAGILVTSRFMEMISRSGFVITGEKDAQATLVGEVLSLTDRTSARSGSVTASEKELVLMANARLLGRDGKVLRSVSNLVARENYSADADSFVEKRNRKTALERAAYRLAEDLFYGLADSD